MGLLGLRKREEIGPEGTRPLPLWAVGPMRGRPNHCLRLVQNLQKWAASPKAPGIGQKNPIETVVSLRKEEDPSAVGKGKIATGLLEVQSSSSAKKKVMFGSKKLWSTFFPPSSECR